MNEINIFLTMLKTTMLKHPKVVFFSDRSEFGLGLCFVFFLKRREKNEIGKVVVWTVGSI